MMAGILPPKWGERSVTCSRLRSSWPVLACTIVLGCGSSSPATPDAAGAAMDATGVDGSDAPEPSVACQGPGTLDASFGVGGVIEPILGLSPGQVASGGAVAIDSQGRIVVVSGLHQGPRSCIVARFLGDGSRDPSFGANGVSLVGVEQYMCWHSDLALQADGKIVAVGTIDGHNDPRAVLMRYLPDGTLDPSFGDEGVVLSDPMPLTHAMAVAIDSDQRIVVAQQARPGFDPDDPAYFVTRRYLPDGSVDSSFGIGGIAQGAFNNGQDSLFDLEIQPDGKIVVVGSAGALDYSFFHFGIVRYTADGFRDPTFGSMGLATVDFGLHSGASAVATDSLGRIVMVGGVSNGGGNGHGALARLMSDGSLDASFQGIGKVVEPWPYLGYSSMAISSQDEEILAIGTSDTGTLRLARYETTGLLDSTFGSSGFAEALPLPGWRQSWGDLAVQPDGRIVVLGSYGDSSSFDLVVARYCP